MKVLIQHQIGNAETQYRLKTTKKYLKFQTCGDKVIYWESQAVNFPVKKK